MIAQGASLFSVALLYDITSLPLSIYIYLGLLGPSFLVATNPRNARILRISDSLNRRVLGIYGIQILKSWRFKILGTNDFPISN